MNKSPVKQYWVFSNKPEGAYDGDLWDMGTIDVREETAV